jgi:hypothetical protein
MITKPVKAAGKRRSVRPVAVVPVVLTPDEAELLRCYRVMNLRQRGENLEMCQWSAEKYPMDTTPKVSAAVAPAGIRLVAVAGRRVMA